MDMPFPDGSFDIVISMNVMNRVRRQGGLSARCGECCAPAAPGRSCGHVRVPPGDDEASTASCAATDSAVPRLLAATGRCWRGRLELERSPSSIGDFRARCVAGSTRGPRPRRDREEQGGRADTTTKSSTSSNTAPHRGGPGPRTTSWSATALSTEPALLLDAAPHRSPRARVQGRRRSSARETSLTTALRTIAAGDHERAHPSSSSPRRTRPRPAVVEPTTPPDPQRDHAFAT